MPKIIKYFLYFFALLLGLILLVLASTQTAPFRKLVRNQVIQRVNDQITGTLAIEQVSGNFFSHLEIDHLSLLGPGADTLAQWDHLSLKYSLWSLWHGTVQLDSIVLQAPRVNLVQESDSSWNFQSLMPPTPQATASPSSPFGFTIDLKTFELRDGHLNINMPDTLIPRYLSDLNMDLSGLYSARLLNVNLENLQFRTPPHIPDLKHLKINVSRKDSLWSLKDFSLITPKNQLTSKAEYQEVSQFSASLNTQEINSDEFAFFLPDLKLGVTPTLYLNITSDKDKLRPELRLNYQNQELKLSGEITRFAQLLNDTTRHLAEVNLLLSFKNFSPQEWLTLEEVPAILNGNLTLKGNGLPGSAYPLALEGNLSDSQWAQYNFSELLVKGQYDAGKTQVQGSVDIGNGRLVAEAFTNLSDSLSPFGMTLQSTRFRADPFLPEWGDSTLLTLQLKAEGTGLISQSPQGKFTLAVDHSMAAKIPIDTLLLSGNYTNKHLVLDTLRLLNTSLLLNAKGSMTPNQEIATTLRADLFNLDAFFPYFSSPAKWEELVVTASARGTTDTMHIQLETNALNADYPTLGHTEKIQLNANGLVTSNGFAGPVYMTVTKALIAGQALDSISFNAMLLPDNWDASLSLSLPDAISLNTEAQGNLTVPLQIHIARLDIKNPKEQFHLKDKRADLLIDSSRIQIENLHLMALSDSLFQLQIDANYQASKSLDLATTVRHFNLNTFNNMGVIANPLEGLVNLKLTAQGPLTQPSLNIAGTIDDFKMESIRIKQIKTEISHLNDAAKMRLSVRSASGDSLVLAAQTPMHINLTDSQMVSTIRTLEGQLTAKNVNPNTFFISETPQQQSIQGILNSEIRVSGNVTAPNLSGYLRFSKGVFAMPAYGILYSNLKLATTFDGHRVIIDSLYSKDKEGDLLISGSALLDTSLMSGKITALNARLKANNFYVSRHNNHKVQIDANIQVKDSAGLPTFGGDLTVERALFYLPGLMEMSPAATTAEPMLVKALNSSHSDSLTLAAPDTFKVILPDASPRKLQSLTGKLNIQIPRNTWIKSEDMSLEIFGDIDLLKNNEYFELFGSLGISRGFYTLYGRKLVIREGEINFQGGEEFNPSINIKAAYQFRGKDKQKNEMVMSAQGTLTEPDLSFALNDQPLTERDAMAYLIFNQSFNELSFSNQEGVSGNVPSSMLTSLLSSQLTKTVGNTFDLDMVEINAKEDWQSATFMVGKYITNNLFVTYQRGFGENKDESLTPQVITLEYELNRHLFFRLTQGEVKDSGIDIIFKFEKP